jgi:hypothetical protein
VHFYNGKYYLFGSCIAEGKCRCTQIFVCDTPDGEFVPLSDEDQDLKARVNKTTADTYATLIDRGVITGAEARLALANDPESGFANIDAGEEIELPEMALPLEGGENETNTKTSLSPGRN